MTVFASDILSRASRIVLDETHVRWPLAELRLWLNDGLREISLVKPTAISASVIFSLTAGTYQKLPSNYTGILRVTRNLKTTTASPRDGGRAVRVVDRVIMDSQLPDWHDTTKTTAAKAVKNVVFEMADPTAFYVYPPNDGTGIVEAVVSKVPTQIAAPSGDQEDIANYNTALDILDVYANALVDYVLYRAYSKDANFAGNAQRAVAHYTQMANALGVSLQNDMAFSNMNAKPTTDQENAA